MPCLIGIDSLVREREAGEGKGEGEGEGEGERAACVRELMPGNFRKLPSLPN